MEKIFSKMLSRGLLTLTLAGFAPVRRPKRLFGLMNVDTSHSLLRVPLTLALLYGESKKSDLKITRTILAGIGIFYLAVGTAGTADKKIGGTLPSGLTGFDKFYHLIVGSVAFWLGTRSGRMLKP
jgi:hypothetical protein